MVQKVKQMLTLSLKGKCFILSSSRELIHLLGVMETLVLRLFVVCKKVCRCRTLAG